jgi:hypothetical protein
MPPTSNSDKDSRGALRPAPCTPRRPAPTNACGIATGNATTYACHTLHHLNEEEGQMHLALIFTEVQCLVFSTGSVYGHHTWRHDALHHNLLLLPSADIHPLPLLPTWHRHSLNVFVCSPALQPAHWCHPILVVMPAGHTIQCLTAVPPPHRNPLPTLAWTPAWLTSRRTTTSNLHPLCAA